MTNKQFNSFKIQFQRQMTLWIWAASVLPLTALAGLFFIWNFGTNTWVSWAMIVGETAMFTIAVIWWWWAIQVLQKLVNHWDETRNTVDSVRTDIRAIKGLVSEIVKPLDSDK